MKNDKVKNQGNKKNPEALPPVLSIIAVSLAVVLILYFDPNFFPQVFYASVASVQSNPASIILLLVASGFALWAIYANTQHPETSALLVGATIMLLLVFPILLVWVVENYYDGKNWEKIGQFGDSFGALTSIFTGGAFVLLWMTYKAQKDELRATREIMKDQKSVIDKQKSVSIFFNTLDLYSRSISNFYLNVGRPRFGNEALAALTKRVRVISTIVCSAESDEAKLEKIKIQKIWYLSRYYRLFAFLIELCHSEFSSDSEAKKYAGIAFASISNTEMIIFSLYLLREKDTARKELLKDYFFRKGLCNPTFHRKITEWVEKCI